MSLVNDMLRDLEARRAPPTERAPLEGLLPADETAVGRRAGLRRLLLALPWLLLTLLAALLLPRLWSAPALSNNLAVTPAAEPAPAVALPVPAAAVATPTVAAEPPIQLLATLPQHGDGRFVLQLLLDRAPAYQRSEQSGVVSLRLPHLRLSDGGPREGRFEHGGRSLNWSLSVLGDGAELLLVGLGDALQVRDRLEPAGERWQLWVEVPLVAETDDFDPARLPVAGAEEPAAPLLADYPAAPRMARERAVAPDDAAQTPRPVRAAPTPAAEVPAAPPAARSPQVNVASHRPDALSEARQALLAGERSRAIALLEELNRRQPENGEALRWLARAWLADGRGERLIAELPARLQRFPADSELRLLLARAQLQAGDSAAAVATLAERMPPLAGDPAYHALLAASYQQTGQWRESAQLYRNLVLLRPEQSAWQLGLGIALEQLGERAAAAQHYRQALQGQGLDDGSRRYARERAQALGGAS